MIGNELQLKKHCYPKESFVGGWYIPEHICDGLLEYFFSEKHIQDQSQHLQLTESHLLSVLLVLLFAEAV